MKGKIGKLTFKRGLGNPAGVFTATSASSRLAAAVDDLRNASGHDRLSRRRPLGRHDPGQSIGKLTVGPANVLVETADEPRFRPARHSRVSDVRGQPGYSLTNAVVTTSGSIGSVERGRDRAQQRGQDRLRLHGLCRRPGRNARGQPDRQAEAATATRSTASARRASGPPTTITTRRPALPGRARSRPRSTAWRCDTGGRNRPGQHRGRALRSRDQAAAGMQAIFRGSELEFQPGSPSCLTSARARCPS